MGKGVIFIPQMLRYIPFQGLTSPFLMALGLLLSFACPVQGQLLHDYELNGSYADAFGGNPMIPNGGTLTATEYVFGPDQGPNVSGILSDPATYCIELTFTPEFTSGWRKIIDFKNLGSDRGLYIFNGKLQFIRTHPVLMLSFHLVCPSMWFLTGMMLRIQ